ncbi:MAG TPA: DUF1289 domain-containing protein [Sphingomonas sp.]
MIPSPCTRICEIDPASGWCRGCGRTLAEIGDWRHAGDAEQRALLARLPARLRRMSPPGGS